MDELFKKSVPELPTGDVEIAVIWYERHLGFKKVFVFGQGPALYAAVKRGSAQINLWLCEDPAVAKNTSCRVMVSDVDAVYAELKPRNKLKPEGEIGDRPWNRREFTLEDLDGNAICFYGAREGEQ